MAVKLMKAEDIYNEYCSRNDIADVVSTGVVLHIRNDRDLYNMVCQHYVDYDVVARQALNRVGEHWCRYEDVSVGTTLSDYLTKTKGLFYAGLYMKVVMSVAAEHLRMLKEIVYVEECQHELNRIAQ